MTTTSTYEQQAEDFLKKFSIRFRATLSDSKVAAWAKDGKHGHHYRVTLSKAASGVRCHVSGKMQNPGERITFDFWASIADAEKGIKTVTPYAVLAAISGDAYCPEDFEDFCGEYGFESDSIKALQTFRRCAAFGRRLRAFFTEEELQALQEIR